MAYEMNTEIQQRHQELCDFIHQDLYLPKNTDYGDSFHKTYESLGIISAVTQISHKYHRLEQLAKNKEHNIVSAVKDESLTDTLLDLANYCILTVMELERESENCANIKETEVNESN